MTHSEPSLANQCGMRPPIPSKGIFQILVCRPNHRLGNTLLLTPLIIELERRYKGAEIDILSEGDIAQEAFATFFNVKNVYSLPKRGFKHPWSFLRLLHRVRKTHYDLIIDPCFGSGFSRALTRVVRGTYKLGFSDKAKGSGLTHPAPHSIAMRHMARRPVNLVRWALGQAPADETSYPAMDIRLIEAELAQGQRVINQLLSLSQQTNASPIVGIFANATGEKRYTQEWWKEFIDAFRIICPSISIVELIPRHGQSMLGAEWPGYYSSDIRRMGAVMACLNLMITADCGVMHLAVASKVPTIGLFCVTDALIYAPYGMGSCALATKDLSPEQAARRVWASFPALSRPQSSPTRLQARCPC